jgi:MFS family permease
MYVAVAASSLAAFVWALLFLAERRPTVSETQRKSDSWKKMYEGWGVLARNHMVLAVSLVQASLYYSFGTLDYFLSGYLKSNLHYDFFSTAAVSGSIIVLAIFVRAYMGRVSDRIGRRKPIIAGLLICSVPLVIMPFTSDLRILLLLALIYGFGFATATASTPALITELAPCEFIGTSTGFLDTVMDIGQTVGPIVGGFVLGTSLGYLGLFLSPVIVLLAACMVFVSFGLARNRNQQC